MLSTKYTKFVRANNPTSPYRGKYMQNVRDSYGQEQKRGRGNPNYGVAKPYWEVREMIKPFHFSSIVEYKEWVKELKRTGAGDGIPLNPQPTYLRKGEWISREHFLGMTDNVTYYKVDANTIPQVSSTKITQPERETISFSKIRTIISQIFGLKREKVSV